VKQRKQVGAGKTNLPAGDAATSRANLKLGSAAGAKATAAKRKLAMEQEQGIARKVYETLWNPIGFNAKKRLTFIEAYSQGGTVKQAAAKAGISEVTVFKAIRKDPEFAAQYKQARETNTDAMERLAEQLALSSDNARPTMLIFMLKARRPNVYRDNATITHEAGDSFAAAFAQAMMTATTGKPQSVAETEAVH
jgi:hypothetical protein